MSFHCFVLVQPGGYLRALLFYPFFDSDDSGACADQEEMGRMIEKYPKLVQTFALQPHLCYDLMCVWEENCLDLLLNDELVSLKTFYCIYI
jgi:hypothetical protein